MPLSADPSETFPFSFLAHRSLPNEKRPVFHLRFLSARDARKAESLLLSVKESLDKGPDAAFDTLDQVIGIGLKSASNARYNGVDFDPAAHKPSDFLNISELFELARAVARGSTPNEDELKNSGSQVESASDPSAQAVPQDNATALPPK